MAKIVFRFPNSARDVFASRADVLDLVVERTAEKTAKDVQTAANANVASSGLKSPKWRNSVKATAISGDRSTSIRVTQSVWQWIFFEKGATIRGNPLWIPLSGMGGERIRARNYPGGLFRVERQGEPDLLLSRETKKPIYVAVEQVTLRKRLDIRETIRREVAKMPETFRQLNRFV